jgi:hypothetical protein
MAFGLADDYCHPRTPEGRLCERRGRIDVFAFYQAGAIREGVMTRMTWSEGYQRPTREVEILARSKAEPPCKSYD